MDALLGKMKEYLKMDSEIPFTEFKDYYQQLIDCLQAGYEKMERPELLTAKFVLDIVNSNSKYRAQRKGADSKKYKKISEKTSFWSDAINYRLIKEGMTQEEIDAGLAQIGQEE